jgi:phospholipid/cholesterol/gamma-HCH transport system substrate-binding protein
MAGLRAGSVTKVELKTNSEIYVRFEVSEKFHDRVREDSVVRVVRPFIIGEKVLDVEVGSDSAPMVAENGAIRSEATADMMDLISGRTLAPYIETVGRMMENLRVVAEAILDPERSKNIVKIFDDLHPLVKNMNAMSREATSLIQQVNSKKKLSHVVDNLVVMTDGVNAMLPMVKELSKNSPELAADLAKIARNMAILTDEVQKTLPMMKEIGPELPRASRRAIEALDETVVTLKALQKSFLLRGNVKDVRDEEAKREEMRAPASEKIPEKTSEKTPEKTSEKNEKK